MFAILTYLLYGLTYLYQRNNLQQYSLNYSLTTLKLCISNKGVLTGFTQCTYVIKESRTVRLQNKVYESMTEECLC